MKYRIASLHETTINLEELPIGACYRRPAGTHYYMKCATIEGEITCVQVNNNRLWTNQPCTQVISVKSELIIYDEEQS
ncbi:MAG: hypothetical protein KAS32_14505 [Candidatus Peribacteraceae bacterium]|nr:hypothetical protein [Candidatus Peribacteraceae bacterium]